MEVYQEIEFMRNIWENSFMLNRYQFNT